MSKESNTTASAISGLGSTLIFIALLVLKLTGFIDWSWWWVTLPLWATVALLIAMFLIGALGVGIYTLVLLAVEKYKVWNRTRNASKTCPSCVELTLRKDKTGAFYCKNCGYLSAFHDFKL